MILHVHKDDTDMVDLQSVANDPDPNARKHYSIINWHYTLCESIIHYAKAPDTKSGQGVGLSALCLSGYATSIMIEIEYEDDPASSFWPPLRDYWCLVNEWSHVKG